MKTLLAFIFPGISIMCHAQLSIDTSSTIVYDSSAITLTNLSPPADDAANNSMVMFSPIAMNQFKEYQKQYHSKINTDSSKITLADSLLLLKTENGTVTFAAKKDYSRYAYYKGFLESLNLFIVQDVDGNNELGSLLLIDNITGKNYIVDSGLDRPLEAPYISPKNDYLLFYVNNLYENNQCIISILKINSSKNKYTLNLFAALDIDQWIIKDVAWISDTSFALSVTSRNSVMDDSTEKVKYLKAVFNR